MEPTSTGKLKAGIAIATLALAVIIGMGLFWFLFLAPQVGTDAQLGRLGWYFFSFAAGLSMIILPCTLPLAFVIVPLSMGRGVVKGLGMALSFGAGVALMLSVYGVVVAMLGMAGISFLGAGGEDVKNWVYFIAGIFAYVFALGEIGLVKFRMPSYTGSAPDFIQKRKDYAKAFLLGMFLGNIGIGCPHPATPLILIEIASSGDVFYGWSLFFVHAIGRVLPLILLALMGILGVNGLTWLVARKEKIERATGWAMVFVAGFILTLGLFSHDWWVNSGQHSYLEVLTQEQWFTNTINTQLATNVPHTHGVRVGAGIFGQPLAWGNWFEILLWVIPFWWYYCREKRRVFGPPPMENGVPCTSRDPVSQKYEEEGLRLRRNWYLTLTLLLIAVFYVLLPFWFMNFKGLEAEHEGGATTHMMNDTGKMMDPSTAASVPMTDESMPHTH